MEEILVNLSFENLVLIAGFLVCLVPATGWKPGQERKESGSELDRLAERARVDMERRRREEGEV